MRRFLGCACALSMLALPVRAVEFGESQVAGKRITFCRVDVRKEHLQVFLRDDAGQPLKRFDPLAALLRRSGQNLVFAMNAGMFHPGFAPVGLCVVNGQTLAPLNLAPGIGNFFLKPNGVFCVSQGTARVVESSGFAGFKDPVALATQSGPLLVLAGRIHPAFNPGSTSRLFRNGVGVPSPDTAIFATSEDQVNLYEFAAFFRDGMHCPDALFLDGSVSSLYAPALKRNDFGMDLGPLIGVTEPLPSR